MNQPRTEDWQVECLRCSVFPRADLTDDVSEVWRSLAEMPPDEIRHQPRQRFVTAEGKWEHGRLRLDIRSNQLDWRVLPSIEDSPSELPSIGLFEECREAFVQTMQNWLQGDCQATNRLAFGTILLLPSSSMGYVYERLDKLLPSVDLASPDISDFVYRINRIRPTRSGIGGLRINRMSNWAALEFVNTLVQVNRNTRQENLVELKDVIPLCRLELDINTAPDFPGELEKTQLEGLFSELVQAGTEIAYEGDIP